tara:strand:- start:6647 stop:8731 length:2085 start_codon:yes stop_codon:yes gene_type:complete
VAAYNADIQVVVKGVNKVTALTNQIKAANKAVNALNKEVIGKNAKGGTEYFDKVGKKARLATLSISNLQKAVSKSSATLNKATLGTDQASDAARSYVAANQALNDQLRQRIALLKQTERAMAFERFAAGDLSGRTQYSSPIGPKPKRGGGGGGTPRQGKGMMSGFSGTRVGQAVLGGGFPALFGQGIGGVAGGAAGGLLGGFAGGIAGSILGSRVEEFAQAAAETGRALASVGDAFDMMQEKSLFSSEAIERNVEALILQGKIQEAATAITDELSTKIGNKGVARLKELGEVSKVTMKLWNELKIQMQAVATKAILPLLKLINKVLGRTTAKNRLSALAEDLEGTEAGKNLAADIAAGSRGRGGGGELGVGQITKTGNLSTEKIQELLDKYREFQEAQRTGASTVGISQEDIKNAETIIEKNRKGLDIALQQLEATKELYQAKLDGNEKEVIKKQEIEKVMKSIKGMNEAELEAARKKLETVYEEADAVKNKAKLQEEADKQELERRKKIADLLATETTNAIVGLIDGTRTLGESLKNIIKQMASMFIQKKMMSFFGGMMGLEEGGYVSNGIKPFSSGGMVTRPTMGLVGEAGEDEYIIPASKMAQSMQRYSAGARGESVIPGTGQSSTGGGANAQTTVNYSGPILNFNSEEFVPKSAIGEIINSAASRGAKAGEARTLASLQNSRSKRSNIGL